MLMRK